MKKILAILRVSTEEQEIESQKVELGTFIKSKLYAEDELEYNIIEYDKRMNFYPTFVL